MSKIARVRASAAAARKRSKERATMDMVLAPVSGIAFGYARKKGWYLPSIPKVGRHATTGGLLLTVGMNLPDSSRIGQTALALGKAAMTLAGYELGYEGGTVAGEYDDDDDVTEVSGE